MEAGRSPRKSMGTRTAPLLRKGKARPTPRQNRNCEAIPLSQPLVFPHDFDRFSILRSLRARADIRRGDASTAGSRHEVTRALSSAARVQRRKVRSGPVEGRISLKEGLARLQLRA